MPHVATVQLPVDGIRGRDMAEEVPIGVFRTLRLQAVLTGHVLNQEAGGPVFQRVAFVVSQYFSSSDRFAPDWRKAVSKREGAVQEQQKKYRINKNPILTILYLSSLNQGKVYSTI
jgi:hypothetical protein